MDHAGPIFVDLDAGVQQLAIRAAAGAPRKRMVVEQDEDAHAQRSEDGDERDEHGAQYAFGAARRADAGHMRCAPPYRR